MPFHLLDTNIVSYLMRTKTPPIKNHFRSEQGGSSLVAISRVTEAELLFGLARRPEATRLANSVHEFLTDITILQWDSAAAKQYAELRAELERQGQPMGNLDLMIAAHALAEDAVLVTNDSAFRRIERLKLEDWTRP
jgi:tRNA(fMet)-specific endonuclease VapC